MKAGAASQALAHGTTARRSTSRPHASVATWWRMARGFVAYFTKPALRCGFEGPFNGQRGRQQLIQSLVRRIGAQVFVETGSFRGTTTEYVAESTGLRVFSVELDPFAFGFCRARFLLERRVRLQHADSRTFLLDLARSAGVGPRVLFYLDAHWNADLPLQEEIDIVFDHWPEATVVIDDFAVPGDEGYGYDDYGPGRVLSLDYLRGCRHGDLEAFFPAMTSDLETGARRGCCVLVLGPTLSSVLDGEALLRRWGGVALP